MFKRVGYILWLLFISVSVFAQEVKSNVSFLDDSVKIGMPIGFSLSAEYPADMDILFPDSSYNFSPYELHYREWFPTRTTEGISKDSAVYYLKTFEIDSLQTFRLQFYQLNAGDSQAHITPIDSFYLIHTVRSAPDSLASIFLQEDTQYYRIDKAFNSPFATAIAIVAIIVIVVLWLVFGGKIRSALEIRRMKRAHERFHSKYGTLLQGLKVEELAVLSENILIHWKRYMEKLDEVPYRKLTTKELSLIKEDDNLIKSLKILDKAIYSRGQIDEVKTNLEQLKDYSQRKYEEKLEKVQHGVDS